MSLIIATIGNSWFSGDMQICMVDCGDGPEKMTVCAYDEQLSTVNPILVMEGIRPQILGVVSGDKRVPLYANGYALKGEYNFKVKRIPGTNIIEGLSTNYACELCYNGKPLYDRTGVIKVSNMANANICVL